MKRITLLLGLLVLSLVRLHGSPAVAAASDPAYVRVLHAVPDAPAVEICVNGATAVASLAYPNETPYVPVPAGALHVQVFVAGTPCTGSGALIDATPTLVAGQFYTIAAVGSLTTGVKAQVLQNANVNPSGTAAVRFAHFSPDAPAVIVTAQGAGTIFGPISFPNATGYLQLSAGTYNVSVRLAASPDAVAVTVPNLQVMAGHIYTAYAIGFASAASSKAFTTAQALTALVSDDTIPAGINVPLSAVLATRTQAGRIAQVRVAHASPGAPNVDVYVDGKRAFTNAPFAAITQYATLPAGTHHVQVFAAGADPMGKAVIDATLTLAPGKAYTVAAIGRLQNIAPLVLTDRNRLPAASMARVRVIHAAPGAPPVDVAVANGPVLFKHLAYGTASMYATVKAGTYNLVVRPTGTNTVVLALHQVRLSARTVYSVFAEGLVGAQPKLRAVVSVDRAAM